MPLNFSGKYWRIQDLEKEFSKPAAIIYPIITSLEGVAKIGSSLLVPDSLLPIIRKRIDISNSYTVGTAAVILRVSQRLIMKMLDYGLPAFKNGGDIRIWKTHIPDLQRAIFEIRQKEGDFNDSHIAEALKKAMNGTQGHD